MNYILLYILFLILLVIISILIVTKSYSQKSVNQKIIAVSATHAFVSHTAPTELTNHNSSLAKVAIPSAKVASASIKAVIETVNAISSISMTESAKANLAKVLADIKALAKHAKDSLESARSNGDATQIIAKIKDLDQLNSAIALASVIVNPLSDSEKEAEETITAVKRMLKVAKDFQTQAENIIKYPKKWMENKTKNSLNISLKNINTYVDDIRTVLKKLDDATNKKNFDLNLFKSKFEDASDLFILITDIFSEEFEKIVIDDHYDFDNIVKQ